MVSRQDIQHARKHLGLDRLSAVLGDGLAPFQPRNADGTYKVRKYEAGVLSLPINRPLKAGVSMPIRDGQPCEIGTDEKGREVIFPVGQQELSAAGINALTVNPGDTVITSPISSADLQMFKCTRHGDSVNKPLTVVVFVPPVALADGTLILPTLLEADFTGNVPGSGLRGYAVVFWNDTNSLEVQYSTPISMLDPLTNLDIEECIAASTAGSVIVWAWVLQDAQTELTPDPAKNLDLRQFVNLPSTGGGGGMTSFTVVGDSGTPQTVNDSETVTYEGGTGIDTVAGATRKITFAIDSTVMTLAGSQTGTNKTFTSPVINTSVSGTAIIDDATFASPSSTKVPTTNAVKGYVDQTVLGLSAKADVRLATAAALPTNTYSNGVSGVGATLTGVATGVLTVDGLTVALNDRLLIKNEVTQANNGIYKCTLAGAIGVAYILTRTTDGDTDAELRGCWMFSTEGTANAGQGWLNTNTSAITFGSTSITWGEFSAGAIAAGTGLTKTGNTLAIDSTVATLTGSQTLTNKILTQLQLLLGGFKAIFTHANTADRTYTLPDQTGLLPVVANVPFRPMCNVASDANITIATPPGSIDGISLASGIRVLLTAQTSGAENGAWVSPGGGGALTRPVDYPSASTFYATTDIVYYVRSGGVYNGSFWRLGTTGAITIDTTATTWSKLELSGFALNIIGTGVKGILTQSITATRQWTFPDTTGNVVIDSATQTLTNKTLTTPTITNFTNAAHDHTNAAGGGTLSLPASIITSGTLNEARLPHKFAVFEEQQAQNTAGGGSTATTWTTRVLNTEVVDADSIVTLSSNKFTPISGTYRIAVNSPFVINTQSGIRLRLRNVTATTVVYVGNNNLQIANGGANVTFVTEFTANGTDEYDIQYWITVAKATNGLGVAINEASAVERYTSVLLEKIA